MSVGVVIHRHLPRGVAGGEGGRQNSTLAPRTPLRPLKMLPHWLLTHTASDEKSDIVFIFVFCVNHVFFPPATLESFSFCNGSEQFNNDVARCGFLHVYSAHGLDILWLENVPSLFLQNYFFSPSLFRDCNYSYIRPFKVVLPFTDAVCSFKNNFLCVSFILGNCNFQAVCVCVFSCATSNIILIPSGEYISSRVFLILVSISQD